MIVSIDEHSLKVNLASNNCLNALIFTFHLFWTFKVFNKISLLILSAFSLFHIKKFFCPRICYYKIVSTIFKNCFFIFFMNISCNLLAKAIHRNNIVCS